MNDAETRLAAALQKKGLVVYRNGWPDFLVTDRSHKTGMALELKVGKDRLRPEQIAMHAALAAFGVPTFVVREDFIEKVNKRGRHIALPQMLETLKQQHARLRQDISMMHRHLEILERELDSASILFDGSPGNTELRLPKHLDETPLVAPYATSRIWPPTPPSGPCVQPLDDTNDGAA